MEPKKFLTVFAVFDNKTENILKEMQDKIIQDYPNGTQTMGIPFHISLGSFPVTSKEELLEKIKSVSLNWKSFDIELSAIGDFNDKVLFVEPMINSKLLELHSLFDCNYANGYAWHPHVTLYCGEEADVKRLKMNLEESYQKMNGKIVGIQMGEFFPTKMLIKKNFKDKK